MRNESCPWTLLSHAETKFRANLLPLGSIAGGFVAAVCTGELLAVAIIATGMAALGLWLRKWTREVRVRDGAIAITSSRRTTIFPAAKIDRVVRQSVVIDLVLVEPIDGMWLIEFMPVDDQVAPRLEQAIATSKRDRQLARARSGRPLREYG